MKVRASTASSYRTRGSTLYSSY
uniref:Uncharacterized protein n=1 Tax=Anguilla anguilla TaxID=7936 RepID=A0A0E9UZ79_ANGAN